LCRGCFACKANTASSTRSISPSASRRGLIFSGQTRMRRMACSKRGSAAAVRGAALQRGGRALGAGGAAAARALARARVEHAL
jgi:hypothetical protein